MSRNRNCIAPGAPFVCRSCLQVRFLFSCGRRQVRRFCRIRPYNSFADLSRSEEDSVAYRFAALCLFSRRSGVLKVCTVFVKRAYSTIPRGFCVISTAQQLKVGRRTNRVRFCFRHPGSLFLTQKRHRTSGNRSLSCLAGHFRLQK